MIRVGIICPSEIAFRRFLPALSNLKDTFTFVGVAIASQEEWFGDISNIPQSVIDEQQQRELAKAETFGGKVFRGYETIIKSEEIDAIYIPLPPALHYKWAKMALQHGKHVMVEKPSTTCLKDTQDLIAEAEKNGLVLHENYMFVFHKQIQALKDIVAQGEKVGTPRLYRISFGFPRRALNDFRYNKKLGGGALLDAGGYTLRYATELLGPTARVTAAQVNYDKDFEVEIFGTATVVNDEGMTVQTAFGMDNDYHCDIEIWGSKGTITSGRILTAPTGCVPNYTLKQNQEYSKFDLPEDDAFGKSLQRFAACVDNAAIRQENYQILLRQETLVQQFHDLAGME